MFYHSWERSSLDGLGLHAFRIRLQSSGGKSAGPLDLGLEITDISTSETGFGNPLLCAKEQQV